MAAATYPLDTICKLLDLTPRRVQQLSKEGVIPKAERGRYELVPAVQGYIKYLRDRAVNADTGGDTYLTDRSRLMKLNADLAELELGERQQQLVRLSVVEKQWAYALSSLRDAMLQIPARVAPVVTTDMTLEDRTALLEREVMTAMDAYVDASKNWKTEDDGTITG